MKRKSIVMVSLALATMVGAGCSSSNSDKMSAETAQKLKGGSSKMDPQKRADFQKGLMAHVGLTTTRK